MNLCCSQVNIIANYRQTNYADKNKYNVMVRKAAKTRKRYNHIPHLTWNTIWESEKTHENITYIRPKRSTLSQQVTTSLQGRDNAVRQIRNTNNKKDTQKKHRLNRLVKILEGFNMFDGTNLTLISDVE